MSAAIAIQAGASILGGIFGSKAASKQARAARAMAEYNASVIRMNAQAEADAIEAQSKRLTKQQREVFAQQRMSVASRGGLETGGDLLSLIESAKNMQLDLLEVQRQRDIAKISGENQANKAIYEGQVSANIARSQGRAAMMKGILGAAGTVAGGFADGTLSLKPKVTPTVTNIGMNTRPTFNIMGGGYGTGGMLA